MKELLKKLCTINGISGNETSVSLFCAEYLHQYTDNVSIDYNNNVVAIFDSKNSDKTILLDAHIDQIGFIVTEVDEKGFIRVDKCGGIDSRTLLGSPVTIFGKDIVEGVICCMPPHLSDGKEDESVSVDKIRIDAGMPAEKIKEIVSAGDYITFKNNFVELLNNRVSSPALDNRAGVAVLLRICQLIDKNDLNCKVVVLFSCQEETYATGAITKSFDITPDEAICVDVSFADQPGISNQYSKIRLGKGPMICYSSTLDKTMSDKFKKIAADKNISCQYEVCGGRTGTNADHISTTKCGVKTAVISVPQKNMHTQVEIVDLNDVENTAKLIYEYIISGGVD